MGTGLAAALALAVLGANELRGGAIRKERARGHTANPLDHTQVDEEIHTEGWP